MEKALATELMRSSMALGASLNAIAEVIEQISDEREKRLFRRAIAELMADVYIKIEAPIIREHEDLDPDRK